ncbi:uncharacterized protein LOC120352668 isoform X2 [Nilaparvata lugens]|nr:uncharacterized protein LOC120352668 isoform X2 [Nilaparvata lugens]
MSCTLFWKNISGSPSNKLDNWNCHTNQEVGGGGWWLTGYMGRRLDSGVPCFFGGVWSGLRRRRYRIGRPHSFISTSWTLIGIYRIDGIINPSRRQLGQVLWVDQFRICCFLLSPVESPLHCPGVGDRPVSWL